jgi:hypothetical protein
MIRFLISALIGLAVGVAVGLYLGWVRFPVQYVDSPASALSQTYKDEYAVMIANGYLADGDLQGAIQRIRVLGIDNVPIYVQGTAERYISNSGDVTDIRPLVALAKALGRLTPPMEPYQQVSVPGQGG